MKREKESLECLFCQKKFPLDIFYPFCPDCQEPLLCPTPQKKRTISLEKSSPLEKHIDFLPLSRVDPNLSLGEGNTPLVKLDRLTIKFNLPPVFVKNEAANPTLSFKDRGTAVAVQKASAMGIGKIGTVSTGNMASSTAAYGARAGWDTLVLLKEDTSMDKLLTSGIHNPVLIKVKGDYGELFTHSFTLGKKHKIYFMNSVDPFRIEGYKITGFEIFHQLKRQIPRYLFVPVSAGGHLTGLIRAFIDLKQEAFIQDFPTIVGVQSQGCSPIVQAFASGNPQVKRIKKANTIAHAISNPDPPGGNIALKLIRDHDGMLIDVSDEDILESQRMLAEIEGIFCQPASATVLAGLINLSRKIKLEKKDPIVLVITGSGLKAMESVELSKTNVHHASLSNLDRTIDSLLQNTQLSGKKRSEELNF
jgi:threonine synthase